MNRNKISKIILLVAVASTTMVGCKKFLDQQPITEIGTQEVFSTKEGAYKALIGAYSRLMGDQGYGIRVSLYYPLDTDEMQGPSGNVGTSDGDRRDIARYQATPSNAQLSRPFNQLFQGIEYANICIDNIPKMSQYTGGSEQEKKQLGRMLGEALTLRAQYYLEAVRNWGDLPMHFEPAYILAGKNQFPSRTDRDSIYDRLLTDLATAANLVPWRKELGSIGDTENERITKGTVKALRARIALYRGGYALRQDGNIRRAANYQDFYRIALQECKEIVASGQHGLNTSFKSLWKDQVCHFASADPDGELMFQASAAGLTSAQDSKLGYYNGPRPGSLGNNSVNPLPSYFYLFDSADLRRDVTIAPYNLGTDAATKIGLAASAMNDGKYRRDWVDPTVVSPTSAQQYLGLKWQIIRYSDVLLMLAEAENELNGATAEAYNAINMVRRRGFGKAIATADATVDIPAGLSKSDFFKVVVRERSLELGGEGVRKYDLIRWNLLAAAIAETKTNLTALGARTAISDPSYMAGYPTYCKTGALPQYMFYITNTKADGLSLGQLYQNSLYVANPSSTAPAGTTRVNWVHSSVGTTNLARFALGYTTGKGELLPIPLAAITANTKLTQNPKY